MPPGLYSLLEPTGLAVGVPPVAAATVGMVSLVDATGVPIGMPGPVVTIVEPMAGQLVADGLVPLVATPQEPAIGIGAVAVDGFAPDIGISQDANTGVGDVVASGFTPEIFVGAQADIEAGDVLITGCAPYAVGWAPCATFDSGVITFDDNLLTWDLVSTCVHQEPAAGGLTADGFAPVAVVTTTDVDNEASPDVGELMVTGFAPEIVIATPTPPTAPAFQWRRRVVALRQTANAAQTVTTPIRRRAPNARELLAETAVTTPVRRRT